MAPSTSSRSASGHSRALLRLALPIMAGTLVETLYNLTDSFFLGKLGAAEVSAPSIAFNLVFLFVVLGTGLAGAATTLIAQAKGRGDAKAMETGLNQAAFYLGAFSIALAALGSLLAGPLLRLLGTPPELFGYARSYLSIVLLGLPASFAYFLLQASLTAVGDAFTPLAVHLLAVGANVLLDPLLIYGLGPFPRLGVAGAAIATVASQALGAFLSIRILAAGRGGLRLRLAAMRPRADSFRLLMRIGLPSSIGQALSALGFTVLQGAVNSFGTSAIAAFGVGNRIVSLFDLPAHGLASATTSLVGQAIGAGEPARARRIVRSGFLACLAFLVPALSFAFFYGSSLVRFFVADPEAMRLGDIMFKIVSPSVLLFGLYCVATGAFQGAGDTRIVMLLAVLRLWGIRVPLAYGFAYLFRLGPRSIWYAMFLSNAATAAVGIAYYRKGDWLRALEPRPAPFRGRARPGPRGMGPG